MTYHNYYILNEAREAIKAKDSLEWAHWFESDAAKGTRPIKTTDLPSHRVSTTFLGLNHSYDESNPEPLIFETMIFKGETWEDVYCERYSTWEQALAQHDEAIAWAKDNLL